MIRIFTQPVSFDTDNAKSRDLSSLNDSVNQFLKTSNIISNKTEFETFTLQNLLGMSTGANVNNAAANTGTLNDTKNVFDTILINAVVEITAGTGIGQRRKILNLGSATQLIVTPVWTTLPDNTSSYSIDRGVWFTVIVDYNIKQT